MQNDLLRAAHVALNRAAKAATKAERAAATLENSHSTAKRHEKAAELAHQQHLVHKEAIAACSTILTRTTDNTTATLEAILNYGLSSTYGRGIRAIATQDMRADRPTTTIEVAEPGGEPVRPLTAHGGGLCQLLGLLARVIIISSTPGAARLLILDEPLSALSEDLHEPVSALLKQLTTELGYQIILTTHQVGLTEHADTIYELTAPGKIQRIR